MPTMEPPTDTPPSDTKETLDPAWRGQHTDRLLAFEILSRSLRACYHPIDPEKLGEKIGQDKGAVHQIVTKLRSHYGTE